MKFKLIFLIVIILNGCNPNLFAKNNDSLIYKNLAVYGQVWGFLKYYHPKPSKIDWDKVLLDSYNDVKQVKSVYELNNKLYKLLEFCPKRKIRDKKIVIPDSLQLNSFAWMQSELINANIKSELDFILNNKVKFKNKYVSIAPKAENPIFNEKNYPDTTSLTEAIKYLSVTRYWNAINYYFPYKKLMKADWNQEYVDYIPRFINSKNYLQYYAILNEMSAKLKDGHGVIVSKIFNPYDHKKWPPFWTQTVSEGTFVKSLRDSDICNEVDILIGDEIINIDSTSIDKCWKRLEETVANSNLEFVQRSPYRLLGTKKDSTIFQIEREGDTLSRIVKNYPYKYFKSTNRKIKSPYYLYDKDDRIRNTLYIDMNCLSSRDIDKNFKKELFATDYVIIDLRWYPKFIFHQLTDLFLPKETIFARVTTANYNYPGTIKWLKPEKTGKKNAKCYQGTLILLVDSYTLSLSEYTVMALQTAKNCITIGTRTGGADGNVSDIHLPGDITANFSGLGFYYPDYTPTQQVGVKRDIKMVITKKSIVGEDEILQKAIEYIIFQENKK